MTRCLRCNRSGVAALEFGVIAPVMLTLMIGTFEFINAIRLQSKLNVAAGQLAEMIAGQPNVTEGSAEGPGGTLGDMCTAASYNLVPYDSSKLSAWIASTTVNASGSTGQDWANDTSCPAPYKAGSFTETIYLTNYTDNPRSLFTLDGTPRSAGGTTVRGYSAISVLMIYTYSNVIVPHWLAKQMTFYAIATSRPRSNTIIPCTYPSGSGTAACPGVY